MDRLYARCSVGERAHCTKPYHRGDTINLIGALGITKLRCMMTVDGTVNGDVFEAFTRHILCPNIRRGDIIIWDNLPCHHMKVVSELVASRGATIRPLPPYSPDLNPIELLWSKLKAIIRKLAPKTTRAFNRALDIAMAQIRESDIRAWFHHCGF